MATIRHITDSDYKTNVMDKSQTTFVVVDFYADWCGPCKTIAPLLDKLSETYEGRVLFCKANVEEATEFATDHNVRALPMLIMFRSGKAVNTTIGAQGLESLTKWIEESISDYEESQESDSSSNA